MTEALLLRGMPVAMGELAIYQAGRSPRLPVLVNRATQRSFTISDHLERPIHCGRETRTQCAPKCSLPDFTQSGGLQFFWGGGEKGKFQRENGFWSVVDVRGSLR